MVTSSEDDAGSQLNPSPVRSSFNRDVRMYPFTSFITGPNIVASEVPRVVEYSNSPGAKFFRHSDMLKEVFGYFRKDDYTLQERRELLGFMLISKSSFHYPARVLWSRIGRRFVAVLRLLDLDVWDHGRKRKLFGPPLLYALANNMERLATHIMWEKFLYYADAIEWADVTTVSVCPGTIALVAQLLPRTDPIIFPCLRYLTWTESFTDSNDLLYMLGPSLDELLLRIYDFFDGVSASHAFSDWVARIFHAAGHLCQHIRFFGIDGMGSLILHPSVLNYFGSLHRLTITQAALHSHEEVVAPPTVLHALEDLELVSYHGSNSLLKSLHYLAPFVTNTLRTVNLQSIAGTSVLDTPSFIENFRPLLSLKRLSEVRLNFMLLDFQFTDSDLVTVAKAWPAIVEMGFAFSRLGVSPVPHLQTIGLVATHCRLLKKLTVPFLAGPDVCATFTISAPASHPLREIRTHAMTWDARQNDTITSGLKQAFPQLHGVFNTGSEVDHEYLWAILPPYILCSQIAGYPITRVPRNAFIW